jgi:hypothetical protein
MLPVLSHEVVNCLLDHHILLLLFGDFAAFLSMLLGGLLLKFGCSFCSDLEVAVQRMKSL